MPLITTIQDLKVIYKSRVPKMFYDYCESGSWTEQTFRDNVTDFSKIRLRQRVAIDMSKRSIKTKMLGQDVSMPVALAPVALKLAALAPVVLKLAVLKVVALAPVLFTPVFLPRYRRQQRAPRR